MQITKIEYIDVMLSSVLSRNIGSKYISIALHNDKSVMRLKHALKQFRYRNADEQSAIELINKQIEDCDSYSQLSAKVDVESDFVKQYTPLPVTAYNTQAELDAAYAAYEDKKAKAIETASAAETATESDTTEPAKTSKKTAKAKSAK